MPASNQNNLIILVSESNVGIHQDFISKKNEEVIVFPFLFMPALNQNKNKEIVFINNLKNNDNFNKLVELFKKEKDKRRVNILIGYDLDEQGEFMSHALFEILSLYYQVPASNIFRTPLTEKGYMVFTKFQKLDNYKRYIFLQQKFLQTLAKNREEKLGFKKIIAIKHLILFKKNLEKIKKRYFTIDKQEIINIQGVSTVTYITKYALDLQEKSFDDIDE